MRLGKILGFIIGLFWHGVPGALLGLFFGHIFDVWFNSKNLLQQNLFWQRQLGKTFFASIFQVMGYVAKADGQVDEAELEAARAVMHRMHLNTAQQQEAMFLFTHGKSPEFKLEECLNQFLRSCRGNGILIQMFIDIQMQAVKLSGSPKPQKRAALQRIFQRLGYVPYEFHQHYEGHASGQRANSRMHSANKLAEAYALLGLGRTASAEEVKKAYRRLMSQHHPDKLAARGLSEEMMKLATEKAQNIQLAYDLIRKHLSF